MIDYIELVGIIMVVSGIIFILGYITGYKDITTIPRGNETIHMIKLHNGQFKVESEYKELFDTKIFKGFRSRDIAT